MSTADAVLHTDGAAFGNPGPSGIGIVLARDSEVLAEVSEPIGWGTNNEAEYRALIRGLQLAIGHGIRTLVVNSDSKLVVMQMRGEWKVNEQRLQVLRDEARAIARDFERVRYVHVRRKLNERADALSKAGAEVAAELGAVGPRETPSG